MLLLLTACVKPVEPPPGTLSKDKMVDILIDIHIAEARAGQVNLRSQDSTQMYYNYLEAKVFKKHKIDTATYNRSYRFYTNNMKYMDEIYAAVVDSLSLRESMGKIK